MNANNFEKGSKGLKQALEHAKSKVVDFVLFGGDLADLLNLSPRTPLVVSTHVPFQSLYYPAVEGVVKDVDMFSNFKEVWDILLDHDLKVILQGHQHLHEELLVNNTNFVTGGAVSAAWWSGPLLNTEEGYILVSVDEKQNFSWEYIDYGWDANAK